MLRNWEEDGCSQVGINSMGTVIVLTTPFIDVIG